METITTEIRKIFPRADRLTPDWFQNKTTVVAQALLGKLLVNETTKGVTAGYIVETEAYLGAEDQASHSFQRKRSPKNESMYQQAGTLYLYRMHRHTLLNVVTGPLNQPEAVLIRAIEPVIGERIMQENRAQHGVNLTNGPGKLTQALGISYMLDGYLLNQANVSIWDVSQVPMDIVATPRIGIPNKGEWTHRPLRYTVLGHPHISGQLKKEVRTSVWQNRK